MRYALVTLTLFGAGLLPAQNRPQMTWEGSVSGSAVLYIQGDRVDAQGRETGAVDRPRYNFTAALPGVRQRVELDVRRGRGRVQIVEQPTPDNEYSAVVRIDPPGTRPENYVLDFFWNADAYTSDDRRGNRRNNPNNPTGTRNRTNDRLGSTGSGEMTWTGDVDNEVLIEVRGRRAVARNVRGQSVSGENASFSGALPRNASVQLLDAQGRGRVELVEQPTQQNGNVAVVRILDSQGGSGRYSFRLAWNGGGSGDDYYDSAPLTSGSGGILSPDGYPNTASQTGVGGSMMRWSGRVDGKVRVTVRDSRAYSTTVSGRRVEGERASFGSPLPRRDVGDIDVRKLQGRDDVDVIQRPSSSNGYTLVFEIDDSDGGADDYVVEMSWR